MMGETAQLSPRRLSVCLATASLLAASAGCGDLTDLSQLLETTLSVSDSLVSEASPIKLDIMFATSGPASVRIDPAPCPWPFEIIAPSGEIVAPASVLCPDGRLESATIGPGESFRLTYLWNGEASVGDRGRVPPGTYYLRGWFDVLDFGLVYSDSVEVRVVDRLSELWRQAVRPPVTEDPAQS